MIYFFKKRIVAITKKQNNGLWLSLVERCVRDAEAAGSNPVNPTKRALPFVLPLGIQMEVFLIFKLFLVIF